MKPWAAWFYKSKAWLECRLGFLRSKHFICERCEGAATIAHHKVYLTPENINDPDITLNWDLLEALCQECHNTEHHGSGEEVTRDGLVFNEFGELVQAE
jgi:hypothetical protein